MATEFVDAAVAENKIVIFSKTTCPFCNMAKKAFDTLKETYLAVELDKREDANAIQDVLNSKTGSRTVPKVFVDGVCLGGGTDVKKLHETGKLATILKK